MMAIIGMCRGFGVGAFSAIQFLEQEYNQLYISLNEPRAVYVCLCGLSLIASVLITT